MSQSNVITGTVKWFNATKGFGFIEQTEGQDIFLHQSVVKRSGLVASAVTTGMSIVVDTFVKDDRTQATVINEIAGVPTTPIAQDERKAAWERRQQKKAAGTHCLKPFTLKQGEHGTGRLKENFNSDKGFGFIAVTCPAGHRDVFVHISMIPNDLYNETLEGREIVFAVASEERNGEIKHSAVPIGLVAELAAEVS